MTTCKNPLCVQNHNVVYEMNRFFVEYPNEKISQDDFMKIQYTVWQLVKEKLNLKVE